MSLTAEDGGFTFEINNGMGAQVVKAENAYEPGTWSTVSVILTDDTAKLAVNGNTAAIATITADPIEIVSEDASYLIGDGMNGSMDYFRVNFKEVAEPEYYYTEKEEISEESGQVMVGDVNSDMSVDIFDMITMRKIILNPELANTKQIKAAADTNGDNEVNIADAVTMQHYLLGRINEFPAGSIVDY